MKALLSALFLLTTSANAQVISCPKLYPSEDMALSTGLKENTRLQPGHLSYAYMDSRQLYAEQTMIPPSGRKVSGGRDIEYHFASGDSNWLICKYGGSQWGDGNIERWERLGPNVTECVLKIREIKERSYPTRWTATATCR